MAVSPAMEKLRSMVATSAIYDGDRDDEDYTGECLPGTRERYLQLLSEWADKGPSEKRVEWVNGVAGAGKTAMTRSFCDLLEATLHIPVASFFVWKSDGNRNTLRHFPATISSQLARAIPTLVSTLERAIDEDPFLLQSAFKKQMNKLVVLPLLDACDAVKRERHIIIVIDGVDELDFKGQQDLLDFIPQLLSQISSLPISLLVTSRPEPQITGAFNRRKLDSITSRITLEESEADILLFLIAKFEEINEAFPYLAKRYGRWPSEGVIKTMVRLSSGFFIWPSVAMGYIAATGQGLRHNDRLELVLSSSSVEPWKDNIDKLYRAILIAHAPRNPSEFDRFKRRLALLCLPVAAALFVDNVVDDTVNCGDAPIRAVFEQTLEDVWDSVADLASIFSPRQPLSGGQSPLPILSHRSFRDFSFNRARCGDDFYYRSEQDLQAEVVEKFILSFNIKQTFESAEFNGRAIANMRGFVESHCKEAAKGELGRCMDDIYLEHIPTSWPLLVQAFLVQNLYEGLYVISAEPDFPEGLPRREALHSKVQVFFRSRVAAAHRWDIALLRMIVSNVVRWHPHENAHSVYCWHVARNNAHCHCLHASPYFLHLNVYQASFRDRATLFASFNTLLSVGENDIAQDALDMLRFVLSIGEANELAVYFSIKLDDWIINLLKHCPPSQDLYNSLVSVCAVPLPDFPDFPDFLEREDVGPEQLVSTLLQQTKEFNAYTERCREAGLETNFPPIEIPDEYWQHEKTKKELLEYGYKPPIGSTPGLPDAPTPPRSLTPDTEDDFQPPEVAEDIPLDVASAQSSPMPVGIPPNIILVPDSVPTSSVEDAAGSSEIELINIAGRPRRRDGVRQFLKSLPFRR